MFWGGTKSNASTERGGRGLSAGELSTGGFRIMVLRNASLFKASMAKVALFSCWTTDEVVVCPTLLSPSAIEYESTKMWKYH